MVARGGFEPQNEMHLSVVQRHLDRRNVRLDFQGVRFGPKVGQIGPKWDKSGTFSDQISVHFGSPSQNVLNYDLKKSYTCTIRANLTH